MGKILVNLGSRVPYITVQEPVRDQQLQICYRRERFVLLCRALGRYLVRMLDCVHSQLRPSVPTLRHSSSDGHLPDPRYGPDL